MDIIFEILFDLIVDGSAELIKSEKVPVVIKRLIVTIMLLLYFSLIVLLTYIGINKRIHFLFIVSILLIVLLVIFYFKKIKKHLV